MITKKAFASMKPAKRWEFLQRQIKRQKEIAQINKGDLHKLAEQNSLQRMQFCRKQSEVDKLYSENQILKGRLGELGDPMAQIAFDATHWPEREFKKALQ